MGSAWPLCLQGLRGVQEARERIVSGWAGLQARVFKFNESLDIKEHSIAKHILLPSANTHQQELERGTRSDAQWEVGNHHISKAPPSHRYRDERKRFNVSMLRWDRNQNPAQHPGHELANRRKDIHATLYNAPGRIQVLNHYRQQHGAKGGGEATKWTIQQTLLKTLCQFRNKI